MKSSMLNDGRFVLVRAFPPAQVERQWRQFLLSVDLRTHYTTPEYFHEPFFRDKRPFAVLSVIGQEIVAVCTGIHDGSAIKCGLSMRPQMAMSRLADPEAAAAGLVAGLLEEGSSSELVDLFTWSQLPSVARWGF